MAGAKLVWNDDAVKRDFKEAKRRAGLATVADAAAQAQQPGYAPRDTSALANDITFGQEDENTFWFGAPTINYALINEVDATRHHPNGGPFYLRRSADKMFPTFPDRLKQELG